MTTIQDLYTYSTLAFAAYADLSAGKPDVDALINQAEMSRLQADDFASKWRVVDQYQDASGVSATVFEEIGTNKRYLAIRGTESAGDINADYILALGFPSYLNPQFIRLQAQVETWLNDGTLSNGFSVTGHSLGGYLAAAISTSFRSQAGETYMYNAPGVGGLAGNVLDAFRAAFGFDGTALVSGITNVRGTAGFSAIAGLGVQLAPPIFVETESNPNPFANHSIISLSDALAIYDLFTRLSPMVSVDTVTNILKAGWHTRNTAAIADKSLENALDAVRGLIADYQQGTSNANVTSTIPNDRDDFYKNLLNLQNEIKSLSLYNPDTQSLGLNVQSLADAHKDGLVAAAKFSAATRYALYKLNPFTVTGNAAIYDRINTDGSLTLYDPATGTGNLSDQYLKDRSAFLTNKILSGVGDKSAQSGDPLAIRNGSPLYFEDRGSTSTYGLYQGGNNAVSEIPFEEIAQVVFGHSGTDLIGGGDQADHLYGMAGDDSLEGKKGNDYLEGGQGSDTYTYTSGDGLDTVLDTDGLGKIRFDGVLLNGGDKLFGETYHSADQKFLYTLLHNQGSPDSLLISGMGGQIIVKDFQSGELGINLNGGTTPAPTSVFTGTANHDADLIDSGVPLGVAGGGVLDTNWRNYAAYGQVLYHDADDVGGMFFISRFGQPYPANTIFDALYGEAGDDYLLGNPGGHDFLIDGGAGNDWIVADYNFSWQTFRASTDYAALSTGVTISGGDGNDAILGGLQGDAIDAGSGNDQVFADPEGEVGIAEGEDYIEGGSGNDWLSGGRGADVIFGGPDTTTEADHDTLLGGADSDYLEGGAGNDTLYGDTDGGFSRRFVNVGNGTVHLVAWNGATQSHIIPDFHDASPVTLSFLHDVTASEAGDDYLDGGTGQDKLFGGAGDDLLDGGADNDKLYGEAGDDELQGGDGDDKLWGDLDNATFNQDQQIAETHGTLSLFNREYAAGFDAEGNDLLDGGAGNDELYGAGGDDILQGGEGDDKLVGGEGADVLDGGLGDDLIYRDADDTVVFRAGDGHDQITSASGGLLRIEGITPDELAITSIAGSDGYQYLTLGFGDDSISVQGGFLGGNQTYQIGGVTLTQRDLMQYAPSLNVQGRDTDDTIYGGNADDYLRGEKGNDILDGQGGNDTLDGGYGSDTYLFGRGYGRDVIQEYDIAGSIDTLRFGEGIAATDLISSLEGYNLVIRIRGSDDQLTIYDWGDWGDYSRIERVEFADGTVMDSTDLLQRPLGTEERDTMFGGSGNDILFGRGGSDEIRGENGDDILAPGTGGDDLIGGNGSDVYLFNAGEGWGNYIQDTWLTDPTGIDTLSFGSGIRPEDIEAYMTYQYGRSELYLHNSVTDDEVWINWAETDYFGYDNTQTTQNHAIERIQFWGEGDDRIFDLKALVSSRVDELRAAGSSPFSWRRTPIPLFTPEAIQAFELTGQVDFAGGQYALNYATTGEVYDFTNDTAPVVVNPIPDQTAGQYFPVSIQLPFDTFADADAGDTLRYFTRQPDWLEFDPGTLTLKGTPGYPSVFDVTVIAADRYDLYAQDTFSIVVEPYSGVITGTAGNDTITGTPVADTLYGLAGNDRLSGGNDNDVLDGGTGADEMRGGSGDDTYIVDNAGDKVMEDADAGTDVVQSTVSYVLSQNIENLTLTGNDNVSGTGNSLDNILIGNDADNILFGQAGNDTLNGQDGADSLFGNDGNDTLDGGAGSDVLTGESGDDLLLGGANNDQLIAGDGNDTLNGGDGVDILDGGVGVDSLSGEAGDDILMGGADNDQLSGGEGNDALNSGQGTDLLNGGVGNDTYIFNGGDGGDVIIDTKGIDRIAFGGGITADSLNLSQYLSDDGHYYLRIGYGSEGDNVVIRDGSFGNVESYQFYDGSSLSYSELMQRHSLSVPDGATYVQGLMERYRNQIRSEYFTPLAVAGYVQAGADSVVKDVNTGNGYYRNVEHYSGNFSVVTQVTDADLISRQSTPYQTNSSSYLEQHPSNIFPVSSNQIISVSEDSAQFYVSSLQEARDLAGSLYGYPPGVFSGGAYWFGDIRYFDPTPQNDLYYLSFIDPVNYAGIPVAGYLLSEVAIFILPQARFSSPPALVPRSPTDSLYTRYSESDTTLTLELIQGGDSNNTIHATGWSIVDGGAGNDIIQAGVFYGGSTILAAIGPLLYGGAGNDFILGSNQIDLIIGGSGDDLLRGGEGDDVYVFNLGDGQDTVIEGSSVNEPPPPGPRGRGDSGEGGLPPTIDNGINRLRFGPSIGLQDIQAQQVGTDLVIRVGVSGDSIRLVDFNAASNRVVEFLEFADGSSASIFDVLTSTPAPTDGDDTLVFGNQNDIIDALGGNDTISAGAGNDTITGGTGNDTLSGDTGDDTYVFNPGDGIDTIDDLALVGEGNTVQLGTGIDPAALTLSYGGNILLLNLGGGDQLRLTHFDPNDVYGGHAVETFQFADGTVLTYAQLIDRGFDLVGTAGDDTIQGTNGVDRIIGGDGNDVINGGGGNDVIDGGAGNDTLHGGTGNDTYRFDASNGTDTLYDNGGETNTLVLGSGVDPASITLNLGSLFLNIGNGEGVHIEGFDPNDAENTGVIDTFEFADGAVLSYADLLALGFDITGTDADDILTGTSVTDRITGGLGNDTSNGGAGDDTYYYSLGDGTDTIRDSAGNDTFTLTGAALADLNTSVSGDDLVLELPDGNTITIQDWFVAADHQIETITLDGVSYTASYIEAWGHAPVVAVPVPDIGADEDSLFNLDISTYFTDADLSQGDILTYSATLVGGGNLPTWLGFDATTGNFAGIPLQADVGGLDIEITATDSVGRSVSDVFTLTANNVNDAPIVANSILDQSIDEDSTFNFTLPAAIFADEDSVLGDTLTLSASLSDGTVLPDWLTFDPVTGAFTGTPDNWEVGNYDIRVTATDTAGTSVFDDFVLTVNNVNDAPILANPAPDQLATEGVAFSHILAGDAFSDDDRIHGDVLTYTASLADGSGLPAWLTFDTATQTFTGTASADSTLTGTDGDDVLVDSDTGIAGTWDIQVTATDTSGVSASDVLALTLQGVPGNDTLQGGQGNDTLNGGGGDDTYIYNLGDGLDTLSDREGQDTVAFGTGIHFDNTVIRTEGGIAHLRLLDTDGCETAEGMDIVLNSDGSSPIETFAFTDGSSYTLADLTIQQKTWYGDKKANTIITGRNDDTIYAGKGGDTVYGRTGNDTLYGEKGKDYLYGEGGNDALIGDKGDDYLNGGCGDDTLDGGKGHNTLIGGKGNDTLILGEGENTIHFNLGDGHDTLIRQGKEHEDNEIKFGTGITEQNLWFSRGGNDLNINVLGTNDSMTLQGWYDSKHQPIEEIKTSNGYELEDKKIELLVQAMAGFTPVPGSGGVLPTEMPDELQATLAAAWET